MCGCVVAMTPTVQNHTFSATHLVNTREWHPGRNSHINGMLITTDPSCKHQLLQAGAVLLADGAWWQAKGVTLPWCDQHVLQLSEGWHAGQAQESVQVQE